MDAVNLKYVFIRFDWPVKIGSDSCGGYKYTLHSFHTQQLQVRSLQLQRIITLRKTQFLHSFQARSSIISSYSLLIIT